MRTTPSGLDAPTRNPGLDTVNNMPTGPPTQALAPLSGRHRALIQPPAPLSGRHRALTQPPAPLSGRHRALMQPPAPLSGRHRALMQPPAPLSGRHRALMQPPAPLSAHNTPFQRFFAQQRRHRFQRPHTTNQQRCHWLQIPPVARQISKTAGSAPCTHATAGTTVGPQHIISAIVRSTEASPVSKNAHNQPTEVSLVADPACSPPIRKDRRIHASLGGKSHIEDELHQVAWTTVM